MIEVKYESDGLIVATCERILVTAVGGKITQPFLAAAHRAGRELGESFPDGIGSLTLTSPDVEIPQNEIRSEASRMTKESNAWVGAGATVILGRGFKASASRSVLTAITLFGTRKPPRRVFDAPPAAVTWLTAEVGGKSTQARLLRWCGQQGFGEE